MISLFLISISIDFADAQECIGQRDTLLINISAAQAKDTIAVYANNPGFVVLDVRTASEYATKHIEEGVNLDYYSADFASVLGTFDRSKVYLLHCASGGRSGQVFTMMQNMKFRTVYNMIGGIGAWSGAGYFTTTTTAAIPGVCNTLAFFKDVPLNETDSIKLTVTNAANDILTFSDITDLSGKSFSTNFDTSMTLAGSRDYSFYIYYTPVNSLPDSVVFSVQTNGGPLDFKVHGTTAMSTNIGKAATRNNFVFNDIANRQIVFATESLSLRTEYSLYDMSGRLIINSDLQKGNRIDYSGFKNGIYFLRLSSEEGYRTYKLLLFPL